MLILIRHGEATHHTLRLTGGWTDSELTAKGEAQISALAEKLAKDFAKKPQKFRILTSDLKRAMRSAEIIAERLGIDTVEPCHFLREKCNGKAAGLTEEEAKALYRKPATEQELDHANYPEGETRREFFNRNVEGLWNYCDVEEENLIIVAHKGTVQNILFKYLSMDMEKVRDFNLACDVMPASLTVLGKNKWHEHCIFRLNDVSHLNMEEGFGVFDFKFERK